YAVGAVVLDARAGTQPQSLECAAGDESRTAAGAQGGASGAVSDAGAGCGTVVVAGTHADGAGGPVSGSARRGGEGSGAGAGVGARARGVGATAVGACTV